MGHERVGALPRTKRWRDVVGGITDAASIDGDVSGLANATLKPESTEGHRWTA